MLLMVEKGIRGGSRHTIHPYSKANIEHTERYDKKKESSYFTYSDLHNFYG